MTRLAIIFSLLFATPVWAGKYSCVGHEVNGYQSTHSNHLKFRALSFSFEACEYPFGNKICSEVFLDGVSKTAYFAEGKWIFFKPHGSFDTRSKYLTFKMKDAPLELSPNEAERWFEGQCE